MNSRVEEVFRSTRPRAFPGISPETTSYDLLCEQPNSLCYVVGVFNGGFRESYFLKVPKKNTKQSRDYFKREAEFYQGIGMGNEISILLPKFVRASTSPRVFLVLEDLSKTHNSFDRNNNLRVEELNAMVTTLAHLHAASLCTSLMTQNATPAGIRSEFMRDAHEHFPLFIRNAQSRLQPTLERLISKMIACLPALLASRYSSSHERALCIVHADPHPGNFLMDKATGKIILVDWQDWKIAMPTHDLVHLLVSSNLSCVSFRQIVSNVIDLYGTLLRKLGVNNDMYPDQQFVEDLKLASLRSICVALRHWRIGLEPKIWKRQLDSSLELCGMFDAWSMLETS